MLRSLVFFFFIEKKKKNNELSVGAEEAGALMLDLIRFTCFTSTKVQILTQNRYAAFRAGDLDARSYCTSFFDLLAGAEEAGAQFFV